MTDKAADRQVALCDALDWLFHDHLRDHLIPDALWSRLLQQGPLNPAEIEQAIGEAADSADVVALRQLLGSVVTRHLQTAIERAARVPA